MEYRSMIYKLLLKKNNQDQIIIRIDDDGLCRLSCSEEHPDYLEWLAKGNTPLPPDLLPPDTE